MKQNKHISKFKTLPLLTSIVSSFLLIVFSFFLVKYSLKGKYFELLPIIIGGFLFLLSIINLFYILAKKTYLLDIENEELTIKYFFGVHKSVISLNDIEKYALTRDFGSGKEILHLFTTKKRHKITLYDFKNPLVFKAYLTKGKSRNKTFQKKHPRNKKGIINKLMGAILIVMALFILYFSLIAETKVKNIAKSELVTIQGKLSNKLEILKGSKGSRSIHIYIEEFPEFDFMLSNFNYKAVNKEALISEVRENDILALDIKKQDYSKKIVETQGLSFLDKTVNYKFITVYGLRKNDKEYFSINIYNKLRNNDNSFGKLVFPFIAIYLLFMGVRVFNSDK